jgi:hypothetical protein
MLKVLSNAAGVVSFRAVMKKEIEVYASYSYCVSPENPLMCSTQEKGYER